MTPEELINYWIENEWPVNEESFLQAMRDMAVIGSGMIRANQDGTFECIPIDLTDDKMILVNT